jgi:glyoxylase-like metal-dependent hydrolase (beta-lactamase superfamily II)
MNLTPMNFVMARAYLLETDGGLLLVDAGPVFAAQRILRRVRSLPSKSGDLRWVVVTHADADHTGGLSKVKEETGAEVMASAAAARAIQSGKSSRPLNLPGWLLSLLKAMLTYPPVMVDRLVTDGEVLPGGLQVLETSGHTPGHLSFFQPEAKALFSGDSVLPHGRTLDPSTGAFCWDDNLARQAFDRQMALKPDHIYGGHGIWHRARS